MDFKLKALILSLLLLAITPSVFADMMGAEIFILTPAFFLCLFLFNFCWNVVVAFAAYKLVLKNFFDKINYSQTRNLFIKITLVGFGADIIGFITITSLGQIPNYASFFIYAFWIFLFEFVLIWHSKLVNRDLSAKMAVFFALFANPEILLALIGFAGFNFGEVFYFLLGLLLLLPLIASLIWRKLELKLKKGKTKPF